MINNILDFLKKRPGLVFLLLILSWITFVNIKPDLYLMGWDNYSSYFNLKTNIFRTFFATWREYRGLGVASDSESTDFFRQLFFLILSPFFKTNLLDQIFILFSFNFGVILVYLLSKKIFAHLLYNDESKLDLIGALTGIFYIFNLNTLATFYFPMIMYINRFYTVPLLFYFFLSLIEKNFSFRKILLFLFLVIFSSGTYITATIFITVIISLSIFLLFQTHNLRKAFIYILFFSLLNSFWILPFVNYTISKSSIVYKAPTFIDANEIQLNKPQSFYSAFKQLILYPNFLEDKITSFNGRLSSSIHPLGNNFYKFPYNFFLLIFPFFYLLGAFYFLYRRDKKLIWITILIFLYLFLSFKAFSFLGFFYIFLEKKIPYFGSLFRFGDTKFHYFIAFAGSFSAGFIALKLIERFNKKNFFLVLTFFSIGFLIIFKTYFTGHFVGFFDLNKLPNAYFEIAKIINDDKEYFRVLHLPFNKDRYWRSYNWGYLGSSFFHFLIDKPLLEKTFEPASQENAELNQEIHEKIAYKKKEDLYYLLKKIGVKYIIFDETVSPFIPTKGIGFWGKYNYFAAKEMIENLEEEGLIFKFVSKNINIFEYLDVYEKIFPLEKEDLELLAKKKHYKIILYQLKNYDKKFRLVKNYKFTDFKDSNINFDSNFDTLQDDIRYSFEIKPFNRKDVIFKIKNNRVEANFYNFNFQPKINYLVGLNDINISYQQLNLEIYSKIENNYLFFNFYINPYPEIIINNKIISNRFKIKEIKISLEKVSDSLLKFEDLKKYLSNWQKAFSYEKVSGLRIKIKDTIIPVPLNLNSKENYIGSLVVNEGNLRVEILKEDTPLAVDLNELKLTDNPNCFGDKLIDYQYKVNHEVNSFNLQSQNGSTCFILPINTQSKYTEIKIDYSSQSKDLDDWYLKDNKTSKPYLQSVIKKLKKPNYLYTCVKERNVDNCFNTHQIINLKSFDSVIIPTEREINAYEPIIFFALKNISYQSQNLSVKNLIIKKFKSVLEDDLEVKLENKNFYFSVKENSKLRISFYLPLNYYSFYQNKKDGFNLSNGLCNKPNSYRTFRDNGYLISYFENCDNNFFQTLNFDSNNSYIWSINYNLASGKFPRFNLGDSFNNYLNQILSLYQGYPNIKDFKEFQNPEFFFKSKKNIEKKISNLTLATTSVILPPNEALEDKKNKNFMIAHDSENEGLSFYDDFNVIQIPNSWIDLSIKPENNFYSNNLINDISISYKKILPSLYKVESNISLEDFYLLFNEGYDRQWGIYNSFFDLVSGKKAGNNIKCNSYANCFNITSKGHKYYIFYAPEKLYLFGWVTTFFSLLFILRLYNKF